VVDAEANATDRTQYQRSPGAVIVERAESRFVARYRQTLPDEQAKRLRLSVGLTDLYLVDTGDLIEAKRSAAHRYVRDALGQILDYAAHCTQPVNRLSALFPAKPTDSDVRLLNAYGIDCLYWEGGNDFLRHLAAHPDRKCTCCNAEPPWCPGGEYVFLGPRGGHFRRSNYATRIIRPAADGWYPERKGPHPRPAMPVLVDMSAPWPGVPLPPWPPALPGEPYAPPTGRGVPRLAGKEGSGRCPACGLTILLRRDGTVVKHKRNGAQCAGTGGWPAGPVPVASWLGLRTGLTAHGLRHGHQTWLDEIGVRYVLQSERMGHEVPGMRGVYSHITPRMRAELQAGLQELWEASLHERSRLAARSAVAVLDGLLAPFRDRSIP